MLYEPIENDLHTLLAHEGITAKRWEADPGESFEPHVHAYNKRLWCTEGSLRISVFDETFSLLAGDAFDLPANTMHEATAGIGGCVCYEAQIA